MLIVNVMYITSITFTILIFSYSGVEFEDEMLICGSCWFGKDKFSLGLDFPNLPYYVDGDVKVTQSNAILRFIARKYDNKMLGTNMTEMAR